MPKSLVLVVGAGASSEVNLPVGSRLRDHIADVLDIRYEHGHSRMSGDGTIDEALRILARERDSARVDINPYLYACWRIRDAMPQSISIDNFIDSHRKDDLITVCGKLAVTRCILAAESQSTLYINPRGDNRKINFKNLQNTWFNSFFQLLHENCAEDDIEERCSKVAIVCFNYDRCIEHYLHGALQNYYGMSAEKATAVVANLSIYHPYGTVGQLPWQSPPAGPDYGAEPGARLLIDLARGVRTFTEGIDPANSSILDIRKTLAEADRLAFVGFAFHQLNLQLLFPGLANGEKVKHRPTYLTSFGISNGDLGVIRRELGNLGAIHDPEFHPIDKKAAELFGEFRRSLALQ